MFSPYCPRRGDIVWLKFSPQAGHEQAGRRPAITLSPETYNKKTGLAVFCPVTSQVKGYPFEVALPPDGKVRGVILSDQVRNLDWRSREARFCCRAPEEVLTAALDRLAVLVGFS